MKKELKQILESMVEYAIKDKEWHKEELINRIQNNKLTQNDIKRLIGLFKLDTQAIIFAFEHGIHPITGCTWDIDKRYYQSWYSNREKDLVRLIRRNKEVIDQLEEMLE